MSRQVKITLSDDEYRLLKLWATWHDKAPATYAAQVVAARIETNAKLIAELVENAAKARGMTPEELESLWLNEPGQTQAEESE